LVNTSIRNATESKDWKVLFITKVLVIQ